MLLNLDPSQFFYYFPNNPHQFISKEFVSLNANKVDRIVRLVEETDKVQIGLIAGIKDGILKSPFSAPFGGFHFRSENCYPEVIESFIESLISFAETENLKNIQITLPPDIYSQSTNAKVINTLIRLGFKMQLPEITNWVDLTKFNEIYTHNASRTYYNQAVKNKLEFHEVTSLEDKQSIYNLIVANRERMGRPIYMTFEDILETSRLFPTDFLKVINPDGEIVAGAIFYRAHKEIAYAVFWGDALEGRAVRAMDFLIFNLWSFYKKAGFTFIDLGTSTESGIPNEGLLRFKETHECVSSIRHTFTWC